MTPRAAAAALLTLGLLAPACASDGDGAGSSTTSAPAPSSSTEGTRTAAGEVLATYSRTGGLPGRRFEVVVRPDGTFEGGTGKPGRGRLGAAALEELRGLVAAFAAARPEPTYGTPVPDGFTTSVTAGGSLTSIVPGATAPPPVLLLVSFLAGLERQLPR
jgi:hypothetical protein